MTIRKIPWVEFFSNSQGISAILLLLTGMYLRLFHIQGQFLLGDEWHALTVAKTHTLPELILMYFKNATSIPLNVYCRILLVTVGWNEILIRFPSIISGLAALVALPLLIRRITNNSTAIIFLFFLSLSPFHIFYSRFARPYSTFVFLLFVCTLSTYLWLRDNDKLYMLIASISGALSLYFHLFALPAVAVALVSPALCKMIRKDKTGSNRFEVSWRAIITYWTVFLFLIISFFSFPMLLGMKKMIFGYIFIDRRDNIGMQTMLGILPFLSGTHNGIATAFLMLASLWGFVAILRTNTFLTALLASTAGFSVLFTYIVKPVCVEIPNVFFRYNFIILPVFLFFLAVGLNNIIQRLIRRGNGAKEKKGHALIPVILTIAMAIFYFRMTPLVNLIQEYSNFTLHAAFQESYETMNWEATYRSYDYPSKGEMHDVHTRGCGIAPGYMSQTQSQIPAFYKRIRLQHDVTAIIEYPFLLHDHLNIHYFYQHFHGKRVIGGILLKQYSFKDGGEDSPPIQTIGSILSATPRQMTLEEIQRLAGNLPGPAQTLVRKFVAFAGSSTVDAKKKEEDRYHFTNLVNICDLDAIRNSGASFIVIHKDYFNEIKGKQTISVMAESQEIKSILEAELGLPYYEDSTIWVFDLTAHDTDLSLLRGSTLTGSKFSLIRDSRSCT